MISHLLDIVFRAIFLENLPLSFFLGMCTFLAISKRLESAIGLGGAVLVIMTITVPANNLVLHRLLMPGNLAWAGLAHIDLSFLGLLVYVSIIAAVVQVLEMVLDRYLPGLYNTLGIFLPLLTVNCAILGVCLFMVIRSYSFWQTVAYGFGSGLGWGVAILAMAGQSSE